MLISVHHHILMIMMVQDFLVAFFDSTMNDYILLIVKCTYNQIKAFSIDTCIYFYKIVFFLVYLTFLFGVRSNRHHLFNKKLAHFTPFYTVNCINCRFKLISHYIIH